LWDFETNAGSVELIDGFDVLGRDLAFAAIQHLDVERGGLLTPETREDIRIVVKRVAQRDDRVARIISPIEVEPADDATRMAEVRLELVAETGERGEHILPL
jgi:hypothetical protein